MYNQLSEGIWPDRTKWLAMLLVICIIITSFPKIPAARASSSYHVTLSTSNFGIQFLHVQADSLSNPQHVTFSLTNGAALWYSIEVQSQPAGLQPVASDPFGDIVSTELAQHGLLPPSGIIPLNANGTFFETVHLATSFSGPGQSIQLTLNPFNVRAATFDVLNLLLQLLGENNTDVQVGLLAPGHLQEILDEVGTANDLVSLIGDFKNMLQAVPTNTLAVFGDANAFVNDLLKLFANANELKVLGEILVSIVGPVIPGIAETLASFAAGIGTFLATVKLAKFLADLALSFGSYLFQQGTFPAVTLQATTSASPTPTPDFTRFVGVWYAHAEYMKINANGTATYAGRVFVWCTEDPRPPCDTDTGGIVGGLNAQIRFTSVNGNTATGSITGGTGDRDFSSNIIPVGSTISITLNDNDTLKVSDGALLCGPQAIQNQVDAGCTSGA